MALEAFYSAFEDRNLYGQAAAGAGCVFGVGGGGRGGRVGGCMGVVVFIHTFLKLIIKLKNVK
jgi:hypothetical protein